MQTKQWSPVNASGFGEFSASSRRHDPMLVLNHDLFKLQHGWKSRFSRETVRTLFV